MKKQLLTLVALGFAVSVAAACSAPADGLIEDPIPNDPNNPNDPNTPPAKACTEVSQGRTYKGFEGEALEATRLKENVGQDRARLKPFAALNEEFVRVFGAAPASLAGATDSFAVPPARWYDEPQATGVGLAALYNISFEAGLAYAKANAPYATAPTAQTAATECAAFMKKAWMRTAVPAEIGQCVTLATTGVAKEPNAQRKWAYVFAMIVTSSPFLTY
jgi:hypothetical protein